MFLDFHQRGGPRPWLYQAMAPALSLLVVLPPSAPLEMPASPLHADERGASVLAGWSEAVPANAPVLELGRSLETGGRGSSDGRGGLAGSGVPDEAGHRAGPGSGLLHRGAAGLRTPLPRSAPARPAGAFLPHRATAPPYRA